MSASGRVPGDAARDWTGGHVEVVDVTDELVRLFEPSEPTLRHVAELRRVAPVDLDDLDRGDR